MRAHLKICFVVTSLVTNSKPTSLPARTVCVLISHPKTGYFETFPDRSRENEKDVIVARPVLSEITELNWFRPLKTVSTISRFYWFLKIKLLYWLFHHHHMSFMQLGHWSVPFTQYCAGDIMEKNEMGWTCGAYGWGEGVYRVLVGKPEVKRPLGRPRRRWVDNIRMDLQEVGCGYMDWIGLAQDRDRWGTLVSAVMNLRVPWNAGNFLTSCKPVSCSGRTLHHGVSK